ncbi:alkyl sulfatase-like protein [Streptomyces sp. KhCrAH-43]|nr:MULTISPECIES: alkyl sulfatase C-terminal domain-containing protein [unclassified Streptomyces]MYS34166.1 hypothetical protein [Streptomyces sp. SID4920]MYX67201.1 hypothetical protein [Streptomyces sp. SID8373]RAJ43247.1 alkyl sulfatase-like protein [Streptomyces sp. KhCrAH-43]
MTIEQLPVTKVVEGPRVRLDAADTRLTLGFRFTDTGDARALEIRRGVAVFHLEPPLSVDATLVTTAALIHQLLLGTTTPADALRHGDITVEEIPQPSTRSSATSTNRPLNPSVSSSADSHQLDHPPTSARPGNGSMR